MYKMIHPAEPFCSNELLKRNRSVAQKILSHSLPLYFMLITSAKQVMLSYRSVCLSACVCLQNTSKSHERILIEIF